MTIEQLQTISLICFILAGVFFIASGVLFFLLRIAAVFGYLTGINARREIEDIQSQSGASESARLRPGKQTKKKREHLSMRLSGDPDSVSVSTAKLSTSKLKKEAVETTVLAPETTVLAPETTVLAPETTVLAPETTVLAPETTVLAPETTVLNAADPSNLDYGTQSDVQQHRDVFSIDYEICFAVSKEIIR